VFAYVDIGFLSGRTMILLGTVLGALAVLQRVAAEDPQPASAVPEEDRPSVRRSVAGIPVADTWA
jgi:hypothetical protein